MLRSHCPICVKARVNLIKGGLLDSGLPTTFRNTNPVLYNPTRTRSSFLNHLAVGLIHDALQLMSGCCSAKPDKNPSTLTLKFLSHPCLPRVRRWNPKIMYPSRGDFFYRFINASSSFKLCRYYTKNYSVSKELFLVFLPLISIVFGFFSSGSSLLIVIVNNPLTNSAPSITRYSPRVNCFVNLRCAIP